MKFLKPKLRYILKDRKFYICLIILLAALGGLDYLLSGKPLTDSASIWHRFVEPFVGLGTLFTAVAVWWGEISQDWLESLPKRLTVEFRYMGSLRMRCEHARLSSEADIRQLGQQIGLQMASEKQRLDFKVAEINYSAGEVQNGKDGKDYLSFTVIFDLTALPEKLRGMEPGTYLEWKPPFDGEPKTMADATNPRIL
jgi:hypothetical protein